MQNVQIVYCPSCGAPVKFLENREDTFCTSCGHQLFREDTHLEMKLKHEEFKIQQANEEIEKKREWKFFSIMWICLGIMIVVGWAVLILH